MRIAAVALALCFLGACKVDARVAIDARANGHGTVETTVVLDRAAYQALRDAKSTIETRDLIKAGWRVKGPDATKDGGVRIKASRAFRSPEEAQQLVAQLSGKEGPLTAFHLTRHHSLLRTSLSASSTVDLRQGIDAFTDERFRALVGGANLGATDPAELQQRIGTPPDKLVAFHVEVRLPGEHLDQAVPLGHRATIAVHSQAWNVVVIGLGALAVVAAAGAAVLFRYSR